MATFKYLLDHDVSHLSSCFSLKQTLQLEDVGLKSSAPDEEVIAVASERRCIIITNNRRDFERYVPEFIAESTRKKLGCKQVHGLVIVTPSDRLVQEQAIARASKQLVFEDRPIGWKEVQSLCLQVVIPRSGRPIVTKLPRCPECEFNDE